MEIGPVASFISAFAIFIGALLAFRHFAIAQTTALIARYSAPSFHETRVAVYKFIRDIERLEHEAQRTYIREMLSNHTEGNLQKRDHIWSMCMLFSEMGFAKLSFQLYPSAFTAMNRLIPCYWNRLAPYVREFNIREGFLKEHDGHNMDDPNLPLGAFKAFQTIYLWFESHGAKNKKPNPWPA